VRGVLARRAHADVESEPGAGAVERDRDLDAHQAHAPVAGAGGDLGRDPGDGLRDLGGVEGENRGDAGRTGLRDAGGVANVSDSGPQGLGDPRGDPFEGRVGERLQRLDAR
jgi:hypothetical protein